MKYLSRMEDAMNKDLSWRALGLHRDTQSS